MLVRKICHRCKIETANKYMSKRNYPLVNERIVTEQTSTLILDSTWFCPQIRSLIKVTDDTPASCPYSLEHIMAE